MEPDEGIDGSAVVSRKITTRLKLETPHVGSPEEISSFQAFLRDVLTEVKLINFFQLSFSCLLNSIIAVKIFMRNKRTKLIPCVS